MLGALSYVFFIMDALVAFEMKLAAFSGLNREVAIEYDWFLLSGPTNQRRIISENLVMLPNR